MAVRRTYSRETVISRGHEARASAAGLMRGHHLGSLVVADDPVDAPLPVAILTDRHVTRVARRAPVLDRSGALVGIISADDMVEYLGEQITKRARVVEKQPSCERS